MGDFSAATCPTASFSPHASPTHYTLDSLNPEYRMLSTSSLQGRRQGRNTAHPRCATPVFSSPYPLLAPADRPSAGFLFVRNSLCFLIMSASMQNHIRSHQVADGLSNPIFCTKIGNTNPIFHVKIGNRTMIEFVYARRCPYDPSSTRTTN